VHEPHDRSIQTKSVVEMPSDRHEQEADGIAEMVTHPPRAASTIRHESIAASRVAFAVQRAPANFSERASSSGPGLESQTITPSEQAAARSLIVDDDAREVGPGQMRKTEFLDQTEREVCAAADAELAAAGRTAVGCPYIRNWLGFYRTQSSQHVERAL